MTSVYEDEFSKMTPEKARKMRDSFENQLNSSRDRLILVKNRRHKILKKLDKEIADIEEQISMIKNTIDELDRCFFNTEEFDYDIHETNFDEVF